MEEELLLTSVQVLNSGSKAKITNILEEYNFGEEFIGIFNRLYLNRNFPQRLSDS
jgi:hypothetical protein